MILCLFFGIVRSANEANKEYLLNTMTARKNAERENTLLRAAIEELQLQSDDKAVIGQLHLQIAAIRTNEELTKSAVDELNGRLLTLQASLFRVTAILQ